MLALYTQNINDGNNYFYLIVGAREREFKLPQRSLPFHEAQLDLIKSY